MSKSFTGIQNEVGRWANNLTVNKQQLLVKLARERLKKRYANSSPEMVEKVNMWDDSTVVDGMLYRNSDVLVLEMLIDYYTELTQLAEAINARREKSGVSPTAG